jgi:hypothetical protein
MIFKSFTIIGMLAIWNVAAHAGPAPKELYGKAIAVQWSESQTSKRESDQLVRYTGSAAQMNIYISSVRRPFVRLIS